MSQSKNVDLTLAASVLIGISMDGKNTIRTKLKIRDFEGRRISDPLSLEVAATGTKTYQLTEFQILDAADKVIYATPNESSELKKLVSHPLPIIFEVQKDVVTKVVAEVLAANLCSINSFGYAAFGVKVVDVIPIMLIPLEFNKSSDNYTLTSALFKLESNGSDAINPCPAIEQPLFAATNYLLLRRDILCDQISIKISKPDYLDVILNPTLDQLRNSLKSPFKVILKPGNQECLKEGKILSGGACIFAKAKVGPNKAISLQASADFLIFQGDLALMRTADYQQQYLSRNLIPDLLTLLKDKNYTWGLIPVMLDRNYLSGVQLQAIKDSFDEFADKTGLIFYESNSEGALRISYTNEMNGCLYLPFENRLYLNTDCTQNKGVEHLLLHSLGIYHPQIQKEFIDNNLLKLYHEHSNPEHSSSFITDIPLYDRASFDLCSATGFSSSDYSNCKNPQDPWQCATFAFSTSEISKALAHDSEDYITGCRLNILSELGGLSLLEKVSVNLSKGDMELIAKKYPLNMLLAKALKNSGYKLTLEHLKWYAEKFPEDVKCKDSSGCDSGHIQSLLDYVKN